MYKSLSIILFVCLQLHASAQDLVIQNPVRYMALGDSYTIGTSVEPEERWPSQLVTELRKEGFVINQLKYVATNGWTTSNLFDQLQRDYPGNNYSLVSLLIGVNNQFQRKSITEYQVEFETLLNMAIDYAGGEKSHVFVVSIPDYGFTPFGQSLSDVSSEIDDFNNINRAITEEAGVPYFYITDISRRGLDETDLVASDGLHPSGKMYEEWVDRILEEAKLSLELSEVVLNSQDNYESPELFPNPVQANLFFNQEVSGKITIYSSNGSTILSSNLAQKQSVDVRSLERGTYLLRFETEERVFFSKFIKI